MPKLKERPEVKLDGKIDEKISALITYGCKIKGYTMRDLAVRTGVCVSTLTKHKRDPERITLGEMRRISRALSIPVDDLSTGRVPRDWNPTP